MGTGSFSQWYSGRGMALTTHLDLAKKLKKEQSHTSTPPVGLNGLLSGEIYFTYIIHWVGKIFISNKQQLYEGKISNIRQSPIFLANHHS
jgi:hypothetical protein